MHGAATGGPSEEKSAGQIGAEDQDLKDLQWWVSLPFPPPVSQPGLAVAGNFPPVSCGGTGRERSGEAASSGSKLKNGTPNSQKAQQSPGLPFLLPSCFPHSLISWPSDNPRGGDWWRGQQKPKLREGASFYSQWNYDPQKGTVPGDFSLPVLCPHGPTCSPDCRGGQQTAVTKALSSGQRIVKGGLRELECLNTFKVETIPSTLSNSSRIQWVINDRRKFRKLRETWNKKHTSK